MARWDTVVDELIMNIESAIKNLEKITLWDFSSEKEEKPEDHKGAIDIYLKELLEKIQKLKVVDISPTNKYEAVNIIIYKISFLRYSLSNINFEKHQNKREKILESLIRGEENLKRLLDAAKDEMGS